jgi:predicted MFS family arabinose efflux permease
MPADRLSCPTPAPNRSTVGRHIFAGLCASLVGIGLARFSYTPLLPSLIQAHWFSSGDAVYLGAANLAGYLIGAILGRPMGRHVSNECILRWMMLLVTAAFLACAFPLSVAWFFGWRLVSGVAGGVIMVLVAATVLPHVPAARRGLASGAIFLGLGLGIAGSGTVVPLLLNWGLRDTWIGLGVLSAILTAASWSGWPDTPPANPPRGQSKPRDAAPIRFGSAVHILYVQYALMAVGLVPAMVFLVDFIARGLGAGAHLGSLFWILYGAGAIAGPPVYGFLADRIGPHPTLRIVFLIQTFAVGCLYVSANHLFIALLTVIIGTFPPGIVPLTLARIRELVPHDTHGQNVVWSRATMVFAALQATAGYGYSAIFNASGGNHRLLFLIAAFALGISLILDVAVQLLSRRKIRRAGAMR